MSILSLAHIFTGVNSDMRKLKQVVDQVATSSGLKTPRPKQPTSVDTELSPGLRSSMIIYDGRQQEDYDDRWAQVEGGSPLRWRSCSRCSFLCAKEKPVCEVCGLRALPQEDHICESSTDDALEEDLSRQSSTKSLKEVVIADSASRRGSSESRDSQDGVHLRRLQEATIVKTPLVQVDDANASDGSGDSDAASDCGSDAEDQTSDGCIAGTLDEVPPIGTEVRILYDDDQWHFAVVTAIDGTSAIVRHENGDTALVDVETEAMRLADYVSDDEYDDEEEDSESEASDLAASDAHRKHEECEARIEQACADEDDAHGKDVDGETMDACDDDNSIEAARRKSSLNSAYTYVEHVVSSTLDEPPPVGTLVKVLYDDDLWYAARVKSVSGLTAIVIYEESDEEEELDFAEIAVRSIDYESDSEEDDEDDNAEGGKESDDSVAKCQAQQRGRTEQANRLLQDSGTSPESTGTCASTEPCAALLVIGRQSSVF